MVVDLARVRLDTHFSAALDDVASLNATTLKAVHDRLDLVNALGIRLKGFAPSSGSRSA